jgi:hypothetical protein
MRTDLCVTVSRTAADLAAQADEHYELPRGAVPFS